ncbi:MAG: hypothetical protein M1822_001095 [Bathelium mastoideum]|nr:MAG: hypothetical protein M1822_001095 [Bathelium mastoideum]
MRQCLTSPDGGYYTSHTHGRDQFGQKGDFVTSPEISQVFGELVGIWIVAEWIAQGRKSEGVYIMEVGPGRGTLMDDALRTIRNFPALASAIESVYLVEASASLREAQKQLLCGDAAMRETENGFQSTSRHSDQLKVTWCEDVRFVPKDANKTPFIIAHEFFDALPIHVFQSVAAAPSPPLITTSTGAHPSSPASRRAQEPQWRELMVSPTPAPNRFLATENEVKAAGNQPEFQLVQSKASTPHSLYLPELSPRYKALKSHPDSVLEISPEGQAYAADFAIRIGGGTASNSAPNAAATNAAPSSTSPPSSSPSSSPTIETTSPKANPSGAALILDYGPSATIPTNSLRGIRAHARVSPFAAPGRTDLSADVDFLALAEAAVRASPGVEVHGPVEQGVWLEAMGGRARVAQLVKGAMERASQREGKMLEEGKKDGLRGDVERIEGGWRRLVDRGTQGMGRIYKAMAIVPYVEVEKGGVRRRPVGFGGHVQV